MNRDTWTKAKKAVAERDEGLCVRCGKEAADVHHRMPRGMGGCTDDDRNFGMANLVSLCRPCHDHVHAHPEQSYLDGFLVHTWDDPSCILLRIGKDATLRLDTDGTSKLTDWKSLF